MPKLLLFSDLHARIDILEQLLAVYTHEQCDGIVVAGDITNFGRGTPERDFLTLLQDQAADYLYVHGNSDAPQARQLFEADEHYVHNRTAPKWGLDWMGYGDTTISPFSTYNEQPESKIEQALGSIPDPDNKKLALLLHCPPYGILDHTSAGTSIGSHSIRSWVNTHKPRLVVCGHLHDSGGIAVLDHANGEIAEHFFDGGKPLRLELEPNQDQTILINPTPAREGNFALLELTGSDVRITLQHL